MRLLVDTHLLVWIASQPDRLSAAARSMITRPDNDVLFSAASIWEVAIKASLGRADFRVEPVRLRRGLTAAGYQELAITGAHGIGAGGLPPIHGDPFDRVLIAQARIEGLQLLTHDRTLTQYGPVVTFV